MLCRWWQVIRICLQTKQSEEWIVGAKAAKCKCALQALQAAAEHGNQQRFQKPD